MKRAVKLVSLFIVGVVLFFTLGVSYMLIESFEDTLTHSLRELDNTTWIGRVEYEAVKIGFELVYLSLALLALVAVVVLLIGVAMVVASE